MLFSPIFSDALALNTAEASNFQPRRRFCRSPQLMREWQVRSPQTCICQGPATPRRSQMSQIQAIRTQTRRLHLFFNAGCVIHNDIVDLTVFSPVVQSRLSGNSIFISQSDWPSLALLCRSLWNPFLERFFAGDWRAWITFPIVQSNLPWIWGLRMFLTFPLKRRTLFFQMH